MHATMSLTIVVKYLLSHLGHELLAAKSCVRECVSAGVRVCVRVCLYVCLCLCDYGRELAHKLASV